MYLTVYEEILSILTLITMSIQMYAIFLIQFKSPKEMKDYLFFLNLFSIWDVS
jgi:hypothetical protein